MSEIWENMKDKPYYIDYDGEHFVFIKMPWHHLFFCNYKWYHRLVGGRWININLHGTSVCWMRVKE